APSALVNRGFRSVRDRAFRPFMKLVVLARYPVLALAVLSLAGAVSMFRDGDVTWRFFNNPEETSVSGNIAMLPGATRADTRAMVRELERATLAVAERIVEETGTDPIAFVMTTVGATTGRGLSGEGAKDPDQLGSITIELIDADLRSVSSREIVRRIENEVSRAALLETLSFRSWGSGPGGDNLDVAFYGADIAVLKRAAEAFIARMERIPEVSGLEDSLPYDSTELSLQLTPLGQALGFDIEELGRVLRNRLAGIEAARFPDGVRTATVRVELRAEDRAADFLERTRVRNPDGGWLSLSEIVTVEERAGFASIRRIDGLATVSVTGEISEDDPERAAAVTATMRETILPAIAAEFAVSYEEQGLAEQERAFLSEALVGFVLCLIGIYITLAWIFSGWFRPIVVMSVIPFGLVGTIWGHWLWDVPLSMFTVVGLIGMTGIIINDSIVLITTIQEKAKTRALVPAVIDGTADRLRAVLLTTLTTVMGLSPLLYETSQQAQFLRPTVITLVYGLGFGMVLVLLVVPALVVVQRDIAIAIRAARRMISARRAPSVIRIVSIGAALASAVVVFVTLGPGLVPALPVLTLGMPPVAAMIAGVLVVNLAAFVVAAALGPRQQP
ncbi:MAG: efflux RND transporter permease subunit, partial [Rubricella sp.]